MAVLTLPAFAKIRELRLGVAAPSDDASRPIQRQFPFASPHREMWRGEILFTPMTQADAHALAAFLEARDGRVEPFTVLLAPPAVSQAAPFTASLVVVPAIGAGEIVLKLTPETGDLLAGTLLGLGDIGTPTYQMVEVVETVRASAAATVKIAPRIRTAFPIGAGVALGAVPLKVRLAGDEVAANLDASAGLVTATVVEDLSPVVASLEFWRTENSQYLPLIFGGLG